MSRKDESKYLAAAIGTAFVASMTFAGGAVADANPFELGELDSGYMQLADSHAGDKDAEGKCGEAKCGGDKAEEKEGEKDGEGSCGGDKDAEGSCGGDA